MRRIVTGFGLVLMVLPFEHGPGDDKSHQTRRVFSRIGGLGFASGTGSHPSPGGGRTRRCLSSAAVVPAYLRRSSGWCFVSLCHTSRARTPLCVSGTQTLHLLSAQPVTCSANGPNCSRFSRRDTEVWEQTEHP